MNVRRTLCLFAVFAPAVAVLSDGCVSKSAARKQAEAAFRAGQQQALTRMQQAQGDTVRINGPVRQPVLPWTSNMTVASALVAADYYGPEPSQIILVRAGRATHLNTKELLSGQDLQLLPGDVIQVETAPTGDSRQP